MVTDDAQLEGCGASGSSAPSVFATAGASRSSPVRPAPRACTRLQLRRRLTAHCCVLRHILRAARHRSPPCIVLGNWFPGKPRTDHYSVGDTGFLGNRGQISTATGNWFPGKPRTDLRAAKWPGRTSDGPHYERSDLEFQTSRLHIFAWPSPTEGAVTDSDCVAVQHLRAAAG